MKKNPKKKTEHCCERMDFFLDEKKVLIYYNPIYREYFINLKSFRNYKHVIYNCPWCGYEFPKSLVDTYYEILADDFNIYRNPYTGTYCEILSDENTYDEIDVDIPEEFKSDEWWKKRSL